jgi:hypothetical protein
MASGPERVQEALDNYGVAAKVCASQGAREPRLRPRRRWAVMCGNCEVASVPCGWGAGARDLRWRP